MYTRKPRSCPANLTGASATSSAAGAAATKVAVSEAFADWNYAAEATQSIGGDIDVPACYYMQNGQRGGRVTTGYSVRPAGDFCSCAYKNYDPTG